MRNLGRYLLPTVAVLVDTMLLAAARDGLPGWAAPLYALALVLVVVASRRRPEAAFAAVLASAALTGGAHLMMLWTSYRAGRAVVSRRGTAVVAGAALGGLALQLAARPTEPRMIPNVVFAYLVLVALPLLAGRYLAQHERLVAALDRHNRELRWKRELLAEQERLGERLRIARDMHDSLGRRLSLVTVQAAALEVSPLPAAQREAVRRLAGAARDAVDELHELVGTLCGAGGTAHGADGTPGCPPGAEAIGEVVAEFRAAGVPVAVRLRGEPLPLSAAAGQAAYRVVEEGLTNAAKHAPGLPVTVGLEWEADALLLSVANPLPASPGAGVPAAAVGAGDAADATDTGHGLSGHGLSGLGERVRPAGGLLHHGPSGGEFRLFAMLPADAGAVSGETAWDGGPPPITRVRTAALGLATAVMMFGLLPASVLVGVA
ncbi:sensor histidine kinase [Planomonospora venezuelensis]|uniref:histidine kinase n=1 Tax=Planomonospora venezuelensis TaxID=1999 RepID=A0A841CYF3_PLAVE|nr:histidine kinase [Planomonospora venezuelensis]MBB5960975.1 signal transduction histidine kinase [Planomonospora venezuelensis]GIN01209.1 hypothetical protein Pve01_28670 [Planomonospora venezuelensis]